MTASDQRRLSLSFCNIDDPCNPSISSACFWNAILDWFSTVTSKMDFQPTIFAAIESPLHVWIFNFCLPECSMLLSLPETHHPTHQNKISRSHDFLHASVWLHASLWNRWGAYSYLEASYWIESSRLISICTVLPHIGQVITTYCCLSQKVKVWYIDCAWSQIWSFAVLLI